MISARQKILALFNSHELVTIAIIRANHPELTSEAVRGAIMRAIHSGAMEVAFFDARRRASYRKTAAGVNNAVFEQCRQNWQGYQLHKIFGSACRATA